MTPELPPQGVLSRAGVAPALPFRALAESAATGDEVRALDETTKHLMLELQAVGVAVAEIDYGTNLCHLTAEAARLFGLGVGPMAVDCAKLYGTVHPDDQDQLQRHTETARNPAGPGRWEMNLRVMRSRGRMRWLRLRQQVFFETVGNGCGASSRPVRALLTALDITTLQVSTAGRQHGEEYVRALLDSLPEQLVVLDEQGIICAVNDSWERSAGVWGEAPHPAILGTNYLEVCRRASLTGDAEAMAALEQLEDLLTGRSEFCELEYTCHSTSSQRWFLMHGKRLTHGLHGAILAHVDITARKLAETNVSFLADLCQAFGPLTSEQEIARIAAERLARHFGASCVQISGVSPETHDVMFFCSPPQPQIVEPCATPPLHDCLSGALLAELRARQVVAVDDISTEPRTVTQAAGPKPWNEGAMLLASQILDEGWKLLIALHKTSAYIWRSDEIEVLREAAMRVHLRIERARAEQALRAANETFRQLVEQSVDAIFLSEAEGRYLDVNSAGCQMLGYSREEILNRTVGDMLDPKQLPGWAAEVQRLHRGESVRHEVLFRRQDGSTFVGEVASRHLDDGRLLGVVRDVTDRKRAEEWLRAQDQRKDEFLATLAHELRNPLAPIRTGLELMKLAKDDPALLEETRRTMEGQTQQLITLVNDLLDVSRITQGKLRLRKSRIRLADVVESAVEACRPLIEEAKHQLTVTAPEASVHIYADPHRLAQVLSNLLSNAAKYTPKRGRIALASEVRGNDVVLTVSDNGLGIPTDMRDRVFEMFAQIDHPTERGYTGLGIGLSLVQSLVALHGGSISVASAPDEIGSVFTVHLPSTVRSPPKRKRRQPARKKGSTSQRRVLVVDDNTAAARTLSIVVEMLGHQVLTAPDGQQACHLAADFRPQVILMDIGMPNMNGYEAAHWIRQQPWGEDLLLVALTGWGQEQDRIKTREAGFDHHLVKPAEPAEIERLLSRAEGTHVPR